VFIITTIQTPRPTLPCLSQFYPDKTRTTVPVLSRHSQRWPFLQAQAKQPTIGKTLDDAMAAIERDNQRLKGVLARDYARPGLDKRRLGELIDLIGTIGLGDTDNRSKDILGRVYEYFLGQFASAEGKKGGEFYTPRHVVRLLVEMLAPHENARVYDPCCGSGGMFVQSESFVEMHGGRRGSVAIYGQESNPTTRRVAQMNLAIRGIDGNIAYGDTLHDDQFPDLRADYVLANPPFAIGAATVCVRTNAGHTARRQQVTQTLPGCSTSSTTLRRPARQASF
jgi:type I restriction enzyme M protein